MMYKFKQTIKWFFVTNYGRYALGILLAITGVFSQYGTIDIISTESPIFEYTSATGILLLSCQFVYHVIMAVFLNIKEN